MRALLAELIDLLSTYDELNVIDSVNNTLSFVWVPKTSSNPPFKNSKEWLDIAIKIVWDGTFLLARTIDPTAIDSTIYQMYVNAAVKGDTDMQCTITPKVLLMLEHIEWQMMNYYRGRVRRQNEILGQAPASKWEAPAPCYCTVQNPVAWSLAREKANLRNMHPDVVAQIDKINKGNKCNLVESKADLVGMLWKRQANIRQFEAMKYIEQDDFKRLTIL